MRLYALKLLQPTVFALSFLLLIMNLGQVRCNEEIKFLFHGLSQKYLTMHDNGSVSTVSDTEGPRAHQCLVLKTVIPQDGKTIQLSIYNPSTGRYLCFKKGKLFGMRKKTKHCHFTESFDETRHSEFKQDKRTRELTVAFSMEGKPQKNKKKRNAQFMKVDPKNGDCADYLNETVVPLRHKHNHKHSKKHKSIV